MIKKSITAVIDEISIVTGLFYQNRIEEGYRELDRLLIEMNNLFSAISDEIRNDGVNFLDEAKLNEILMQAMKALEAGDTILFSDIFEYDLKELLSQSINMEN
jgi:hypothetical protein